MSLDNPEARINLQWGADANIVEEEDENGIRWRFENGRWTEVVRDPTYTELYTNMEGIRINQISPENLDEPLQNITL